MIRAKQIGSIKCPKCKQEVVRGQDQNGEWQLFDPETREIHICKPKKPQDPAPEFVKGSQIPREEEESRGSLTPTPPDWIRDWQQSLSSFWAVSILLAGFLIPSFSNLKIPRRRYTVSSGTLKYPFGRSVITGSPSGAEPLDNISSSVIITPSPYYHYNQKYDHNSDKPDIADKPGNRWQRRDHNCPCR